MGIFFLLLIAVAIVAIAVSSKRAKQNQLEQQRAELEPVKKLAFEDVTAFGEQLQGLDADLAGTELDDGANADYQRALDSYEDAKRAGDAMSLPDDIKHVTGIVDDGRYAIACVRARVAGEELPTRRPPCFFDPRHGLSVEDVEWAPAGGVPRDVPACELDAERVKAGAEPDSRQVMVGAERVPYWQGGAAYQPYAAGYFATYAAMNWMVMGLMMSSMGGFGGFGEGDAGGGDGGGDMGGGGGDGGGDMGGGDGGGFFDGGFDIGF